ncbi:hypothetical protein FH972_023617 [Carpinus fangiana]|uniref:Multiple myeloma tumor-associated protein 2-like N-terminal domain-containing protein n=1 Tax=Carpinus fangiana TaxID=176857 RepID=A0A5N6KWB7_9ROSI|nr:hypothetical protein FH972_023617 [Carpinus fangiana]
MDLLQTVRKEGSRGGRSEFKWDDVKDSQHRENYLGHSLMAREYAVLYPYLICLTDRDAAVGRWQKGRDLNWYAKSGEDGQSEADARREELRKVKQAEDDAMAKALGLDPPQRPENNANMTELGPRKDTDKATLTIPEKKPSRYSDGQPKSDQHRDQRRGRQGHGRRQSFRIWQHVCVNALHSAIILEIALQFSNIVRQAFISLNHGVLLWKPDDVGAQTFHTVFVCDLLYTAYRRGVRVHNNPARIFAVLLKVDCASLESLFQNLIHLERTVNPAQNHFPTLFEQVLCGRGLCASPSEHAAQLLECPAFGVRLTFHDEAYGRKDRLEDNCIEGSARGGLALASKHCGLYRCL